MENKTKEMLKSVKNKNAIKGRKGEAEVIAFLEENGYKIIKTNFKTVLGEIDIIAQDSDKRIIFVEVKARETARFGYPREAVNIKKQQTIRRVAELYLKLYKMQNVYTRFDVIEILAGKVTHIKNAF